MIYSIKNAVLSDDGRYRYFLTRAWGDSGGCVCWIMLNPSTADASKDDHTIRKCVGFTNAMGFQRMTVVNLFALRATDPDVMYADPEPVGKDNDGWIEDHTKAATAIVLAWGAVKSEKGKERARVIAQRLRVRNPLCLVRTAKGYPGHPLLVPYSTEPVPFFGSAALVNADPTA